jgi:macrolide transport system ATP-binding/permease protein
MPDWRREVRNRLATIPIPPANEPALVEELAQHLEDRYEEMRASDVNDSEAYRAVVAELQNSDLLSRAPLNMPRVSNNNSVPPGATSTGDMISDFWRDLRFGMRAMRKSTVFTFFSVLTLALGIGANTTVFTIINTLLLHPLPAEDPSHLVALYSTQVKSAKQSNKTLPLSYLDLKDYGDKNSVFQSLSAFAPVLVMAQQTNSGPQRIFGQLVTASYFETLGLHPAAGRFFRRSEDTILGSAPVAVLSYSAWKGRFGADEHIIGRVVDINRVALTVVGVAPKDFLGVSPVFGPDVWIPATMTDQVAPAQLHNDLEDRAKPVFHAIARLKPGTTRAQAEANLQTIASSLRREYPKTNENRAIVVRPISEELYSGGQNSLLFGSVVLLVIVGLVLAIACSNVANLLLARASARTQETAVRLAIGANRGRLVRQLLSENLLLGLLSGIAGLAVGYAGCRFVWSFWPPEYVQNLVAPKIDSNVFLFALFVSMITVVLFGLLPAFRASKTDVVAALKQDARTAGQGRGSTRFANALVVGQVAFSLMALVVAALFLRSIERAYHIDPGFQTKRLAIFMMSPGQAGYNQTRVKDLYRTIRERVDAMPGVAEASWVSNLPFWASASRSVSADGRELRKQSELTTTIVNTVDIGYFRVMDVGIVRGRDFRESDDSSGLPVVVINQAFANEVWPAGDALGQSFHFSGDNVTRHVIGIARNANYGTLGEKPQPCIYLPLRQNFSDGMTLYVKSKGPPEPMLATVSTEIRNIDPKLQVNDARTGQKILDQVLFIPRIGVALLGIFGSVALALASVGLYGLMAYSVNRRRREIGVRMALGASQPAVLRGVLRDGLVLVITGSAIGLGASMLIGYALSSMLFGIGATDPISLAGALAVLIFVSLMACYFPARSATHVDPILALRDA